MARIKSYYTTDETLNGLYTFGGEYMTTDRKEYKGPYHRYTTTNEVYTESKWDLRLSQKLITYVPEHTTVTVYKNIRNIQIPKQEPVSYVPVVDKLALNAGLIQRYFIKKINSSNIIEIDQQQYNDWVNQKIDRVMYVAVNIPWYVTGEIPDIIRNGVTISGVQSKNKQSIMSVYNQMPELVSYLTNLIEYYTDNTFIIPIDINRLDS